MGTRTVYILIADCGDENYDIDYTDDLAHAMGLVNENPQIYGMNKTPLPTITVPQGVSLEDLNIRLLEK